MVFVPQGNILGTSLNSGPFLAHNVPILAARLPFYFYFLDMSTFTVRLAVGGGSVNSTSSAAVSCLKEVPEAPGAEQLFVMVGAHVNWEVCAGVGH